MSLKNLMNISIICILIFAIPVTTAGPTAQLRLDAIGTYEGSSTDAWSDETLVTTDKSFDLQIANNNGGDVYHLYLLVAVDREPSGNVQVSVNGNLLDSSSFNGIITSNSNALISETLVEKSNDWVPYEYPGHGIYNYGSSTRFKVVEIPIPTSSPYNGKLSKDMTLSVPIQITPITSGVKVHFDAVGANDVQHGSAYEAIAFAPPSHDVTYNIPEFPTIVLPVAGALVIMFMFQRRKKEE